MPIVNLAYLSQFTAVNLLTDGGYDREHRQIDNCIEVDLFWTLEDGKTAHNVLHGSVPAAFNPTAAIALALHNSFVTGAPWSGLAATLSTSTHLATTALRDLRIPNQPQIFPSGQTDGPGTGTGESLPNETAAVVTLRTAKAGQRYRGRMYLPGFTVGQMAAGNTIAAGCVTAINNWANSLPGAFTAQGMTFCLGLHSRLAYTGKTGKNHEARPNEVPAIVQQLVRDNHWDSQRKRGLK